MTIASVALAVARHERFDYWVPDGLDVRRGAVVRVLLARRALIGVVVGVGETSDVAQSRLQPLMFLGTSASAVFGSFTT